MSKFPRIRVHINTAHRTRRPYDADLAALTAGALAGGWIFIEMLSGFVAFHRGPALPRAAMALLFFVALTPVIVIPLIPFLPKYRAGAVLLPPEQRHERRLKAVRQLREISLGTFLLFAVPFLFYSFFAMASLYRIVHHLHTPTFFMMLPAALAPTAVTLAGLRRKAYPGTNPLPPA